MTKKAEPKPKLTTDAERHKRFVEMAREVEVSNDPKDLDRAFKKVACPRGTNNQDSRGRKWQSDAPFRVFALVGSFF
jgi:hypothetical protein